MLTWGWNLFVADCIPHPSSWKCSRLALLPVLALMVGCAGSDKRGGFRSPTLPAASEATASLPLSGGIVAAASQKAMDTLTSGQAPINSDMAELAFEIQTLRHRFDEMAPSILRLIRVEKDMSILIAEMDVLMDDPVPLETPVAMAPEPEPKPPVAPATVAEQGEPAAEPSAPIAQIPELKIVQTPDISQISGAVDGAADIPAGAPAPLAVPAPTQIAAAAPQMSSVPAPEPEAMPEPRIDIAALAEKLQIDTTPANGPEASPRPHAYEPEPQDFLESPADPPSPKTAESGSGAWVTLDLALPSDPAPEPMHEPTHEPTHEPEIFQAQSQVESQAEAPIPAIPTSPTGQDTESAPQQPQTQTQAQAQTQTQSCTGYGVHLGSYRKESSMASARLTLSQKHPQALSGLRFDKTEVDLGERGVFLRMTAGPLAGKGDARTVCGILRESGDFCAIVSFKGVGCVASAD